MERLEKLELALKAAMKLRKSIEKPGEVQVAALLIPIEAVESFDKTIKELKDNDAS